MKKFFFVIFIFVIFALFSIFTHNLRLTVNDALSGVPYELQGIPTQRGDRILGIDVNMAEDNDYDKAFELAKSLGSEVTSFSINWKDIEQAPGEFKDSLGNLAIANIYYPNKSKIALYVRAIDTASKMVPADLEKLSFADERMAERYLKMIDWVLAQIPNVELLFLSISDEIDLMMGDDKKLYQEFGVFLKIVKEKVKIKHPNLNVGFTATLYGLTEKMPYELKNLNQYCDVILVSYYPVSDNGLKETSVILRDYDALVRMYVNRIIYIEQTGYPTSQLLKSSEAQQREFIRETFKAWDMFAPQIKYISFAWLTDLSHSELNDYKKYYATNDKYLLEFLRTLGLRTYIGSGQDKEAFRAIHAETKARGW